ncbi:MAG: hypothetical protein KGL13_02270 [Gammaproteobacteria bacterium]|nr:hypothetical protein [Gammaproteobacteria bacterium]MDE2345272.1 hypothetical protein [Gammaproteobacteria bacterium]
METNNETLIKELAQKMQGAHFWMYLVGILMIIGGVLEAISIVGIVFAWLPIWLGVLLCMAASSLNKANMTGDADQLQLMLGRLKMYFVVQGVVSLIVIVLGIVGFLFFRGFIMGMMSNHHF